MACRQAGKQEEVNAGSQLGDWKQVGVQSQVMTDDGNTEDYCRTGEEEQTTGNLMQSWDELAVAELAVCFVTR